MNIEAGLTGNRGGSALGRRGENHPLTDTDSPKTSNYGPFKNFQDIRGLGYFYNLFSMLSIMVF